MLLFVNQLHCEQVGFIQNNFEHFIIKVYSEYLYW
jgi:hypothetical protein